MFKDKLQVEKIERVKQIVRANNYSNYERAHQDCQELGINVNRSALDKFADRLYQTDKGRKQSKLNPVAASIQLAASTLEFKSATETQKQAAISKPVQLKVKKSNSASQLVEKQLSYAEVQKRTQEITFELGELKIRESELLQELTSLKACSNH